MRYITFRTAVKKFGELKKYSPGYNYRTAFVEDKNGQLWYFSIEDLRDAKPMVMRRKAKDLNDYTGGTNRYDVDGILEDMGLAIREKRNFKYDYNQC